MAELQRSAKETLTTAGILSTEDVVSADDMLAKVNVVSAGGVRSAEDVVSTGRVFATEDVVFAMVDVASTGDSVFSNDEVSAALGARTGVDSSEAT